MTDSELLAALRRLKVETGSMACLGCGHEHNCGIHGCAILRVLLEAAESAGYGEAPVVMAGRRFSAMHLRVETLIGAETRGELVELVPDTPQ